MGAPVGIQGTKSGGPPRPGYEELFNDFLQGMKLFRAIWGMQLLGYVKNVMTTC